MDFVDGVLTSFRENCCVRVLFKFGASPRAASTLKLGGPKETPLPNMLKEQLQSADAVLLVHAVKAGR